MSNNIWDRTPLQFQDDATGSNPLRRFPTPHSMWEEALAYFKWCVENPLVESKHYSHEGVAKLAQIPKMRIVTIKGFCIFTGIKEQTFCNWANPRCADYRKDLAPVVEHIRMIIYEEKFVGASAGLLNPLIIARDLGLKEHTAQQIEATVAEAPEAVPDEHMAVHIHPDDPNPLAGNRPLYSRAQLDAGIEFTPPKENQNET